MKSDRERNNDICAEYSLSCRHKEAQLRDMLMDVSGLSELFRALADETRVKILYMLSEQELCVCDLAYLLEMSIPAVSHHLRLLKVMRLVTSRKDGKQVFYSLADDHVISLIRIAREHFVEWRQINGHE